MDDIRVPDDLNNFISSSEILKLYNETDWVVVRNYEDFVKIIKKNGLPEIVSFDHDLGEDVARLKVEKGISKRKARSEKKETNSGYDCAKWLVDYCSKHSKNLPKYLCHSMNPVGKDNILNYLRNFEKIR